jgi:molybdate transport system ATP-binding protein
MPTMALTVDLVVKRGRTIEAAFEAGSDETVAILGPNGAGKTTIVEGVAGLVAEARGPVSLDGERIDGLPPDRRPIGIAFQDGVLFPHLSALENVAFPARARGARPRAARAHARDVLARVAPAVDPEAKPTELSGGARQRVALARALAGAPRVLILDEPLSSVDVSARAELRTQLRRTLDAFDGPRLLVTHDPIEAMTLADRIVVLEDGHVTQTGTPGEIRAAPRTRYAADLVGLNLFRGTLVPIAGGAGELRTADGPITVSWPDGVPVAPVDDVLATLAPADVALHAERPEGSPRNVVRGVVDEVAILGDRARVRLRGAPALVAEITTGSAERMGIVAGTEVWASFKAVELRLIVEPIAADTL